MTSRATILLTLGCAMLGVDAIGQSLLSGRAVGLGAYGVAVTDTRDFSQNPAGLTGLRDWELSVATYVAPRLSDFGFVFHGIALGKRFFDTEAIAVQYSPGTAASFVVPPLLIIGTEGLPASIDREIDYSEPFSFGFGHRFSDDFSVGVGARLRRETVVDTRYELVIRDTVALPVVSSLESRGSWWGVDLGLQLRLSEGVRLSLVGRNLAPITMRTLQDDLREYRLPRKRSVEIALSGALGRSFLLAAQGSSDGTGAVGYEWLPGAGFALRDALYFDRDEDPFFYCASFSAGWSYEIMDLAVSYLLFFAQEHRRGVSPAGEFDVARLRNLDLNPYTPDRVTLSARLIFGNVRSILARIEGVTFTGGIYPSALESFAYRPVGSARIRNVSSRPIEARVSVFVDRFMDRRSESAPVVLSPGETADVPLTAVFNEQVRKVQSLTIKEAEVTVTAVPAESSDDRYQAKLVFYGRNAWNGEASALRYFVTPDDPEVLRYSRDVLVRSREKLTGTPAQLEAFRQAQLLVDTFSGNLSYVADPKESADYVQYPAETLSRRGGDCDDMTVCFSSLLSSMGLSTAFVDVVPPGAEKQSHIYLLFDTGVDPQYGERISDNPKRYVLRRNARGTESIWIPLETTVSAEGFEKAWTRGAQEYYDDVVVGLGLIKGWVRIVDVN